jgi:hypothetical protein
MLGRNPLWVALQHGYRIATMLSVYAAWVEGARECDIAVIRRAMGYKKARATSSSIPMRAGTLLTGWGREPERWVIRVRLDASACVSPEKTSDTAGQVPEPKRPTGQIFASDQATKVAKPLKIVRKSGGADGTRTQAESVTC